MGAYIYTLRKPTKTVENMEIAQYLYSYKPFWGSSSDSRIHRKHAAAERAADSNENVKHFTIGDWEYIPDAEKAKDAHNRMYVWELNNDSYLSSFIVDDAGRTNASIVGHLVREGRKIKFVREG